MIYSSQKYPYQEESYEIISICMEVHRILPAFKTGHGGFADGFPARRFQARSSLYFEGQLFPKIVSLTSKIVFMESKKEKYELRRQHTENAH